MQTTPKTKGLAVVFEGIDGSGKSTAAKAFVDEIAQMGRRVFNLKDWELRASRLPTLEECENFDCLFAAKPTHSWLGAAIRNELIREGAGYDGRTIAEAFALMRLIYLRRLAIPFREAGKMIVQDRGVQTTLVYQPMQKNGLSLEEVMALPGNALALEHAPDLLVIADCRPEIAAERLAARLDKNDDAIFEKIELLRAFDIRYKADWFRKIWADRGTKLIYIDANVPVQEMCVAARALARETLALRLGAR